MNDVEARRKPYVRMFAASRYYLVYLVRFWWQIFLVEFVQRRIF